MNSIKKIKIRVKGIFQGILIIVILTIANSCESERKPKNLEVSEHKKTKHIVLINPFEVPEGKLEESIKYWEACRDFLEKQPGYVSTKLHQSTKNDAKFQLINVAVWESQEAFVNASQKMVKELGMMPPPGLKANPSLYNVIRE